jgi:hypothetical protein
VTNLSELTNAADPILSLDLSKYKSVACLYSATEDIRFTTSRGDVCPPAALNCVSINYQTSGTGST